MKEKSEVPRNAYVVVAEDAEALLAQSETLGEAVGDYLEEQFENVSQIKNRRTPRSDRCTRRWTTGRRHCFAVCYREGRKTGGGAVLCVEAWDAGRHG